MSYEDLIHSEDRAHVLAKPGTSERVLRKTRCPVANLPVGSMLG